MLLWRIHFPWAQSAEELFRSVDRLSLPRGLLPAWPAKNSGAPEGRLLTVPDREWFGLYAIYTTRHISQSHMAAMTRNPTNQIAPHFLPVVTTRHFV